MDGTSGTVTASIAAQTGGRTGSSEASTTSRDYDPNGNLVSVRDAQDHDGDGKPEATTSVYDGFDRVVTNRTNIPGPGGQDQTNYTYDPLDRTTNRVEHVGTASQKNTAGSSVTLSFLSVSFPTKAVT